MYHKTRRGGGIFKATIKHLMKKIVVANWKMNPLSSSEAEELSLFADREGVVVCPPFVFLDSVSRKLEKAKPGAQDCYYEKKGSFTGEISPFMVKDAGCEYVILGHSERRTILKESVDIIEKKLFAAFEARLTPILCIGESEGEEDRAEEVMREQLSGVNKELLRSLFIAYEPVFAIGTGNPCSPEVAEKRKNSLRKILKEKGGNAHGILYGGSVDSKNALDYLRVGFDGLLVGGTSLKREEFSRLLDNLGM